MNRISSLIASLTFCIAMAALFVYGYFDVMSTSESVVAARQEVAEITARDNFAKAAAQFISETSAERAALGTFVIAPDDTASAIELIESAAKVARVDASVASANIREFDAAHHELLSLEVTVRGGYAAVVHFGTMLETLPRVAVVRGVTLETADKGWFATYKIDFLKSKSL